MICILKAIGGYIILMLISTNLLGLIVRGFVYSPKSENDKYNFESILYPKRTKIATSIFFCLVAGGYFYGLYYYWNIGVVAAAAILMIARIPDLLFEIKTGKKITFKAIPKNAIDVICTLLFWLALPLLWYSLCYLK